MDTLAFHQASKCGLCFVEVAGCEKEGSTGLVQGFGSLNTQPGRATGDENCLVRPFALEFFVLDDLVGSRALITRAVRRLMSGDISGSHVDGDCWRVGSGLNALDLEAEGVVLDENHLGGAAELIYLLAIATRCARCPLTVSPNSSS